MKTTYEVGNLHNYSESVEYATRAEALTAAVLKWDAQGQTGDPVEVIEVGVKAKRFFLLEDRERAAVESLIPKVEQANAILLERETDCIMGKYSKEEEKSYDAFLARMKHGMKCAVYALAGADLRPTITSEEIDVTDEEWIKFNYPDVDVCIEQFTYIGVGRWGCNAKTHEWLRYPED